MSPQQPLALTLIEMIMTIAFFPVVIAIAQFVFGVTRPALGEVDSRGHRL
jgi:rod shape-determining protein MreD